MPESNSGSERRNLSLRDFEFEDYDEFIDNEVSSIIDWDPYVTRVSDRGFDYTLNARELYENGLFGQFLSKVHRLPGRSEWNELKDADCIRCGKENVGIYGLYEVVKGPDGERVGINQETCLCENCHETVRNELAEFGEVQPMLGGFA